MPVTRERFEQGMTYAEYKAQMQTNQERFVQTERGVVLPDEHVQFFKQLPQPLNVVVVTEDWCGDAIANVPVIGKLAEAAGTLNVRVFLRDQNLDITDQYLKEGKYRSIPIVVLFDQHMHELGHWIERPASITAMMQQEMGQLFATDPAMAGVVPGTSPAEMPEAARARMGQFFGEFRGRIRTQSDADVVRELREIVERAQ